MSKESTSKIETSYGFRDLQTKIEDYREKRDDLNKKTKEYISGLQRIESQINESLKIAKEVYKKKRDYWNTKVKKLKDKKIEYKTLLEDLSNERRKLQKPNSEHNKYGDLKQINRKIDTLERKIETENLDIAEENAIVDKIRELAEVKKKIMEIQNTDEIFKLDRKIEIVKINLNKIYEQLTKWSNKSQDNHAKMLEEYDKVSLLKENRKKMEEDLIKNKQAADGYHEQLLELMNQRKKFSKSKYPRKSTPRNNKKFRTKDLKKKEEDLLEKMKKEKLASALEKKKAGKKLNLYEARLIFEAQNTKDNSI